MDKNTEILLVGQPILSQVLQLVDKIAFRNLVRKEKLTVIIKHLTRGLTVKELYII